MMKTKPLACAVMLGALFAFLNARAATLGQWTFNDLSSLSNALKSSNTVQGVSLSSFAVHSSGTLEFAGLNNIPSGANDGYGFGGNNGSLVLFYRPKTNGFVNVNTSFGTTNTAAPAAPFSFTVTAAGAAAVFVESLTVDRSDSLATTYYFQEAGANRGTAQSSVGDITVALDAAVLIPAGQSKTFSLVLDDTNLSTRCFNGFTLNGRVSVTTEHQRYSPAAGTNSPPRGWTFYWNKPDGWVAGGSAGDAATGAVTNRASWAPLLWSGTMWTPDGDELANNGPAAYLRVHGSGGHPGAAGSSKFLDRYAIAAYRVSAPGDYQLGLACAEVVSPNSNGLELLLFKNGIFQREFLVTKSAPKQFEARLENLSANDEIAVAVGPNGSANYDSYNLDFTIACATPSFAGAPVLNVADFGAVGDGVTDDLAAINKAIAAAGASPSGAVVRFDGSKTYRIIGTSGVSSVVLPLLSMKNVQVQGNGATLLLQSPNQMLQIKDAENVQVDGFVLNYSPLPYFQGNIVGANVANLTVDISVPTRYAVPQVDPDRTNTAKWSFGRTFVPNSPGSRVGSGMHLYIDAITALDGTGRNLRIYASSNMASVVQQAATTATEVVVPARNMGQTGNFTIQILRSSRILLSNLLIHQAPQFIILPEGNFGPVTFDNVDVLAANPETELFVSWRDCWHVKDNRFGIKLVHCDWNGGAMNDDLFNFSTIMGQIVGVSNQTVNVLLTDAIKNTWAAGDWVRIAAPGQDVVRGYARIVTPVETFNGAFALGLDRAVPGLATNDVIINEALLNRGSLVQHCSNYPLGTRGGGSGRIRTPVRFDLDDFNGTYFWLSTGDGYYLEGPVPADIVFSNTRFSNPNGRLDITSGRNVLFSNCTFTNTTLRTQATLNSNLYLQDVAWVNQASGNVALSLTQTSPAYLYGSNTVNGSTALSNWLSIGSGCSVLYSAPDPLQTPAVGDYDSDGLADLLETPAGLKNPDTDGDGLPDGYEYDHGLNPWNAADALLDLDGDGISNLAEYQAGTAPDNSADGLRSSGWLAGGAFTITVDGRAGRQYTLYRGASLQGPWQAVTSTPLPLGLDGVVELRDAHPLPNAAYYRVGVWWPYEPANP